MRNSTFNFKNFAWSAVLAFSFLIPFSAVAQSTLSTVPPLNGGNGSAGTTFELSANTSILITQFGQSNATVQNLAVWYRPGGVLAPGTTQPNISTAGGWTLIGNGNCPAGGTGIVNPIALPINLLIPAGQSYGFYIGGTSVIYSGTGPITGPSTFTDGNLVITCNASTSFGGAVPSPTFNPRQWNGSVTYVPITGDNSIGIASLDSPQAACPGVQNVVVTVGNFGSNQVNNFDVDWELDGVAQTQVNVSTLLDTLNGLNPTNTQVVLGSVNFVNLQTYNIKAWTSNPNGASDTTNFDDTINANYTSTVPLPSSLAASNLGPNSASLSWVGGAGGSFDIEYGPAGFTPGSGTIVNTSNNPYSLTGLSANTAYNFYVRSVCAPGATSSFAGPFAFTTTCTIYPNPFLENFDSPAWTTGPFAIDQCWSRTPNGTAAPVWQPEDGQTSSTATGPSGDFSGVGKYIYMETSGGALGNVASITSPLIDISNLTAPQVEFYYHMFGATMGTLDLEVSDNGLWVNIFTISGQQQTSLNDPWTKINVPFTTSDDTVQFRFVGTRGSSFTGDMSVDEFKVFQPIPNDLSATSIGTITSGCGLSSTETVSTTILNLGTATFNPGFSFPVAADLNGAVTTESVTLTSSFAPGDTLNYTFTNTFDFSVLGAYVLKVYPTLAGDTANTNDTAIANITNIPIITNFPYSEDFDGGPAGWTTSAGQGGLNSWALGTPAGSSINTAASAPNSWMTNLSGPYPLNEISFVQGPCFSFDSLIVPEVNVSLNWNTNFSWDGAQLQYSLNGGGTWSKVSSFGDPNSTNWYNDNTVDGLVAGFADGDGWSGSGTTGSNGWVVGTADLSNLSGQNDVIFRMAFASSILGGTFDGVAFDNFQIVETALPFNLELISILSPGSGCGLSATESVQIEYANVGLNALTTGTTINFSYFINGVATNENFVLTSDFLPGDTALFTFSTTADLSVPNTYAFGAKSTFAADQNPLNDSLGFSLISIPIISNYPYAEDFDAGPGGWISGGVNSTWALGTPAGTVINSAASAPNSWVTNLTGSYNNNEASFVNGPCFAFDSLIAPELSVDVWWESESSWDGMQAQYSLDGGTTWSKVSFFGDPNSTNWYTDNTINGLVAGFGDGDGWTNGPFPAAGSGQWRTATADLSPIAGQNDVLFRMVFGSDGSVNGFDGLAFDDFQIVETALPFNVELIEIIKPQSGCGLSATDTVEIEFANIGLNPIVSGTSLSLSYYVNGVATNENLVLASDLLPGDTLIYTFTATADFSVPATYAFGAVATFAADQNPLDDSLGFAVISIPVISSFPYFQDFESGNGGWTGSGSNSTWALGTPTGTVINSAASGVNAWTTNLVGSYNNNEASFVNGPCFDFTNLVDPIVKLDIWWDSEPNFDGGQLQASTDAGATWQTVGAFGDPFNWYSDNGIFGVQNAFGNGDAWVNVTFGGGGSLGWLNARNNLTSYAGNSGVLLRVAFGSDGSVNNYNGFAFDDFHILESPNVDIRVDSLIGLQSGCGYTANTPITMRLTNGGITPQTNIPVFYTVNGVASPTDTITSTLNPGQTLVYTFANNADLSTPQLYTIIGRSALITDEDTTNDASQSKIFQALFTPVVDSVVNGETCESGPVTLQVFANGDTDQWFNNATGGTAIGTGATITLPNVIQNDTVYVQSVMNATGCNSASASGRIPVYAFHSTTPIINFTTAVAGNRTIQFTSSLSPNTDSVLWDFKDGTFSTAINPLHTFPTSVTYPVTLTAYSGSCIADTSKNVFAPTVGLIDGAIHNLSVYPNPSKGEFLITATDLNGEVIIEIISITGNVVYKQNAEANADGLSHQVKIDDISTGSYILKIKNDDTVINGRIVID